VLYLVVHNLEGPGLRGGARDGGLATLCALAAAPGVRLVGSVDHVNAALLWGPAALDRLNPAWHDASTFARYDAELPHAAGGAGGGGGAGGRGRGGAAEAGAAEAAGTRSALVVLRSLNANAKGIFLLLVSAQLDAGGGGGEGEGEGGVAAAAAGGVGMPFATLYERCAVGSLHLPPPPPSPFNTHTHTCMICI
jgi:hypothetical protein